MKRDYSNATGASTGPVQSPLADRRHDIAARVKPTVQSDGAVVYARNKKFKSSAANGVHFDGGNSVNIGESKGGVNNLITERPKVKVKDVIVTEDDDIMMMSKRIEIKVRPNTVQELFETGLLEGYPVFYNAGKKAFVLRGTIKDIGILCFCEFCQGAIVIPPSQFEIHAINTYKRATQYICLENGKSLLDIVKECSNAPIKTLAQTIQSLIGPMPKKETVVCRECTKPFVTTFGATMEQACDSCVIHIRRETNAVRTWREANPIDATYVKASVASFRDPEYVPGVETSWSAPKSRRGRRKKNDVPFSMSSQSVPNNKSARRSSVRISSRIKSREKITNKLEQPALLVEENGSFPEHRLATNDATPLISASTRDQWKITKREQQMHKLVFEEGGLPEKTELAYYSRGLKLLEGYKSGKGIFCFCCTSEISPSQFEAHAGWASRRKPYAYIYTSMGVSLDEFAIALLKRRKCRASDNEDLCTICADGGKLVLCDGCPKAFHRECASLSCVPRGKWYCMYCDILFEREKLVEHNANALAAGRISGAEPVEQIVARCLRTVKDPEDAEVIACVICRCYDYSKSGFGPRTLILCNQCEKEYHVGCLKKRKVADIKELPKGKWFCSMDCKRIHSALQNLVKSGGEKLPDSCFGSIRKKEDIRWRVLSGKITARETRLLLSQAVAIFHECFEPILDPETRRDFIPSMVYGRNIRGQDFSGMYCAILTVNSLVVSAGILRIFGQEMAELPLVATRMSHQGKGYFQLLFSCIEKFLAFLKIKSSVLPASTSAEAIWTNKFGYQKMTEQQLINYKKSCWQMMTFKSASMLEKKVPRCRIIRQHEPDSHQDTN